MSVMRHVVPKAAIGLALGAALLARPAWADGYVDVTGATFKPIPLAIEPTIGDPALAATFTQTLRDDLAICGFFDLLNPKSFLVDATAEGTNLSQMDFSKWRAVNAADVAKAILTRTGTKISVEGWLFDAVGPTELLHSTAITAFADDVQTAAHRWANLIVEAVTHTRGYFLTRVAYVKPAGKGHNKEMWASDLDGRHAVDLTPGGGLNLLPSWSPNGRNIVFTSFRDGSPMLYVLDSITRGVTALPHAGSLETGGSYSPDGRQIAFTLSQHGSANIYLVGSDGSGMHAITDTRETNSSPTWSPDGKKIAFVSTRSGDPQIFTMNADGTNVQRLTFQGRYNQTPDWSPRGDEIVFTARDERNVFDIFAVNVENKVIRRLTQDSGHNEEPVWAPNGNSILFTSTRSGKSQLWIMNRDGTNQRPLPAQGEAFTPAWGPLP
jgi:TolB protein